MDLGIGSPSLLPSCRVTGSEASPRAGERCHKQPVVSDQAPREPPSPPCQPRPSASPPFGTGVAIMSSSAASVTKSWVQGARVSVACLPGVPLCRADPAVGHEVSSSPARGAAQLRGGGLWPRGVGGQQRGMLTEGPRTNVERAGCRAATAAVSSEPSALIPAMAAAAGATTPGGPGPAAGRRAFARIPLRVSAVGTALLF